MTFSICVREPYTDEDGTRHHRFGVAVTTRLPGVGTMCPFASEHGAVATQSLVNVELGRKGIDYLEDGLAVEDALEALLNADEGRAQRQLHGVDTEGTFVFSGEECRDWYGHAAGENYTVAGNLLTGPAVVDATAAAYESDAFGDDPLAARLIDALEAGHEEGGDKRTDLPVQSAALLVETTEDVEDEPTSPDLINLRVDASETPVADLRDTYELTLDGWKDAAAKYDDGNGNDGNGNE